MNYFNTFLTSILNPFNTILNRYYKGIYRISLILLLFTIINQDFAYINKGYDYDLQSLVSKSFIEGNGFSIPYVESEDLSVIKYKKLGLWPLGYVILQAPVLAITDYDTILTYRIMNIISDVFLIIVLFFFIRNFILIVNKWFFPVIFFFWTFSLYPFYGLGVNDQLSLSFFLLGGILLVNTLFIKTYRNQSIRYLLIIGVISFLPAFFRYAYYPMIFIVPLLFVYLRFKEYKTIRFKDTIPFLATAGLIIIQMVLMKYYFAYDSNPVESVLPNKEKIVYLENLYSYDSVFLNALISEDYIGRLLFHNQTFNYYRGIIQFIASSVIFLFLIAGFKYYRKHRHQLLVENRGVKILFVVLIIGAFTTTLFLTAISIWFPPFSLEGDAFNRTWVWFSRYHAPVIITIQIILFAFLFLKAKTFIARSVRFSLGVVIIIIQLMNMYYWTIHEKKLTTYTPAEVVADAHKVSAFLKNNVHQDLKTIYLSSKIGTNNEFVENDFSGNLNSSIDANLNIDNSTLKITSRSKVYCILALPKKTDLEKVDVLINLYHLIKNNHDTILYSTTLQKTIIGFEFPIK